MKKIAIIHPLKHHVYYSAAGICNIECLDKKVVLGFYNNNKLIKFILTILKKNEIKGYKYNKIDKYITTSIITKLLFLLKNFKFRYNEIYNKSFEKFSLKQIKDVDIVHVLQDYCNNVVRYAKKNNKIIVYEQITAFNYNKPITEAEMNRRENRKLFLQKENLLMADYILVPSKFVENSLNNTFFGNNIKNKIIRIPYGVNIDKFKFTKRQYRSGEIMNILCIAGICEDKGIKYLLDAMNKLKEFPIKLTYIGVPSSDEGKDLLNIMKEMNNIEYVGRVPHSEIENYFNNSSLFILPSLSEGSSLSTYEALASGLPCIVTENTGSVIENYLDGIIIKERDSKDIVRAIKFFLDNPIKISEYSLNARKKAEKYTWDKYEDRISNIYINKIIK